MMGSSRQKVVVITGANAGIGFALASRLIESNPEIHVCLACRSIGRAQTARQLLLKSYPYADITAVQIDMSSPSSVYKSADELKNRYTHIDYLYLNAGIMPGTTVNWKGFFSKLFSTDFVRMLETGDGLLKQEDGLTFDGLKQIFATNLFGHFILVKELQPIMGGTPGVTQIIWTSSSNAKKSAFHLDDIQHANGDEPYSASKYASDVVSVALNERLNSKARLLTATLTVSPENGCEALVWLSRQRPESLDPQAKFYSQVSITGRQYVKPLKLNIDTQLASNTYEKLDEMESVFHRKYKTGDSVNL